MTIDWVHGVDHSPVCQILLQIAVRMLVTASPPACINSADLLSTPADFPFFKDLTTASTSSRIIGKLSSSVFIGRSNTAACPLVWCSSVFIGQSNTAACPLIWLLYNSVQYSAHRLIIFFLL